MTKRDPNKQKLSFNMLLKSGLLTLDDIFQKIFCICDEYVTSLFVCIYEVRNGTLKKLLGSSFKIMLHYDILRNGLKYYTDRCFK
jgi:hypothetical protein